MIAGIIVIAFGLAVAALSRLTSCTYAHSKGGRTALWIACVVGFTRL